MRARGTDVLRCNRRSSLSLRIFLGTTETSNEDRLVPAIRFRALSEKKAVAEAIPLLTEWSDANLISVTDMS